MRKLARSYNMTLYKLRHTAQGTDVDARSNQVGYRMPGTKDTAHPLAGLVTVQPSGILASEVHKEAILARYANP